MTDQWLDEAGTFKMLGQTYKYEVTLTISGHNGHLRVLVNGVEIEDSYGDQSGAYPDDHGLRGAALQACHARKAVTIAESSLLGFMRFCSENPEESGAIEALRKVLA